MPYTIADAFARLRSNLEITDLQTSVVSTRHQNVRQTVANSLKVVDDFLTGSYARSTMISPLSEADIDVFVCLDPSYFHRFNNANGGPAGLLNLARQTIRQIPPWAWKEAQIRIAKGEATYAVDKAKPAAPAPAPIGPQPQA
ncbi:SMODS domain-containing nucleotidyltransferase [Bradyrhizobium sp. 521_C7_N1_3]|uniref:SMODS domain-containing nucleotidyltransferase n=1 Tax=Bradyrhizobium sp. 521_C7_N1_3 TaxID=3240368 RepID=UPI003F88F881